MKYFKNNEEYKNIWIEKNKEEQEEDGFKEWPGRDSIIINGRYYLL